MCVCVCVCVCVYVKDKNRAVTIQVMHMMDMHVSGILQKQVVSMSRFFSVENWKRLSSEQQSKHTLKNCYMLR